MSQDVSREGGKLDSEKKEIHSNDMKQCRLHKSAPGKSSLTGASFKMTKEGTFTMISRVVTVRHLGGLLCAVGPMVSLFQPFFVTFLGELSFESTWLQHTVSSSLTKEWQNGDSTKPDSTPRSLFNTVRFQANHHTIHTF